MRDETVLLTGMTGSPLDPDLFALRISGDRIDRGWTHDQWKDQAPSADRVVDLDGACVLPGIEDSHLHGYEYGRSLTAVDVRFDACPSLEALQATVRRAPVEANGWVRGIGWDGSHLAGSGPQGRLCAADIDAARTDVPVLLTDVTGHQAVCNTEALRRAGLEGAQADDPVGGVVVRDEHGRATGLLLEAAVSIVNEVTPALGLAEKKQAVRAAQAHLIAQGVTAFTDPGLGPGASTLMDGTGDLDAVEAYRRLDEDGELHMRVDLMLLYGGLGGTTAEAVARGLDAWGPPVRMRQHGHLGVAQVKVFADGIPRSRTAWMSEPYDDCTHGHLTVAGATDEERVREVRAIILEAASRGWQIGVHTTGDRATQTVVDAFVEQPTRPADLRHYIIHGDFAPEDIMRRMAANAVTLNSNPSIRWMVGDGVNPVIGAMRNARRQPLRTAWDLGVNVCSSSDAPVSTPDWRLMVAAAMTRSVRGDAARTDSQRLEGHEALRSLTANAAWQSHAETWRGRLAPGYAADLVVLDGTPDWQEPWSLLECGIRATVIAGRVRHGSL